jgi:hypothetical protein
MFLCSVQNDLLKTSVFNNEKNSSFLTEAGACGANKTPEAGACANKTPALALF